MDAERALEGIRGTLPAGVLVEIEDDMLHVYVSRDMLHLDADALHDRLHHWTLTRLAEAIPAAAATVSFRNATPAEPHEAATLDTQEGWRGLQAMLSLDLTEARAGDADLLRAIVPEFLALVHGEGRPEGFRHPDVGTME